MINTISTFCESASKDISAIVVQAYLECSGIKSDSESIKVALQEGKLKDFVKDTAKKAAVATAIAGLGLAATHVDDTEKIARGMPLTHETRSAK